MKHLTKIHSLFVHVFQNCHQHILKMNYSDQSGTIPVDVATRIKLIVPHFNVHNFQNNSMWGEN